MIPREQSCDLKPLTLLSQSQYSRIFKTNDGRLLKQVSNHVLNVNTSYGINYEEKILHADEIIGMEKIAKPLTAVYNGNVFVGYTMCPFLGMSSKEYYAKQSLPDSCDLYLQAHFYKQLEEIVKEGNKQRMVFPDIGSGGNVLIDERNSISLVDFDGMQYGNYGSISMTETLFQDIENKPKYFITPSICTPEVDKLSLLRFYFLAAFNVQLHHVGEYVHFSVMTLKELFDFLGLVDEEKLFNKVEATMSDYKEGIFLGDEVERIARDYMVIPYKLSGADVYSKRLIKKAS